MEQDRTSPILVHQLELEGQATDQLRNDSQLDSGTRTRTGLQVKAILNTNPYESGVELSKKDMGQLHLTRHKTHPGWNYTLSPRHASEPLRD